MSAGTGRGARSSGSVRVVFCESGNSESWVASKEESGETERWS